VEYFTLVMLGLFILALSVFDVFGLGPAHSFEKGICNQACPRGVQDFFREREEIHCYCNGGTYYNYKFKDN